MRFEGPHFSDVAGLVHCGPSIIRGFSLGLKSIPLLGQLADGVLGIETNHVAPVVTAKLHESCCETFRLLQSSTGRHPGASESLLRNRNERRVSESSKNRRMNSNIRRIALLLKKFVANKQPSKSVAMETRFLSNRPLEKLFNFQLLQQYTAIYHFSANLHQCNNRSDINSV